MAIQIKSFNQILGDMIRKIVSETALNDLNAGSVLLTLLEAAAANDFENNTAILNVLELLNIDAIKNNDLDAKAGDFGLERRAAVKASGLINILNTNIVKRSTGLYVIKPAPISGQTKLYVNNTDGWAASGNLYIGRGTQSFEGPIAYTSITVFPTYSQINLTSALQKDHLSSDVVIDSQGEPDRLVTAGTVVKIPANNQNPEVQYVTLRDAVIPSGEDSVIGVEVIALVAGSLANASVNTITDFDVPPFSGAAVTNTSSFSNGKDIETDVELRNRLKSYAITLARGTAPSIIAAIIGVSDPDDSNQVASAVITEPVKVGDPSILYIDDGSGFQPSFAGQSVDILLTNATGKEEFLQLANYPVPRPQVINVESGPFTLKNGSFLRVIVDGTEETIFFATTDFLNISAATLSEVIVAINAQSVLFKARFVNKSANILLYPVAHDAEVIQVTPLRDADDETLYANSILKFPTDEFSYIALYQNATRLHEKAKSATLTTTSFGQWNVTTTSNIIIAVDGTPAQDRSFALSDFPGASSFASLTIDDWVIAFNNKFAGLTATATPSQTMVIVSNKEGADSSIVVSGGTLLNKWFPNLPLESTGQTAQFELNRQTGNLRILTTINVGDTISAGVEDAKGFVISSTTTSGTYNLSSDAFGRPANMVIVVDSTFCDQVAIPLLIGSTISITNPSASTMRIMSATADAFVALKPGNFIYITPRTSGWVNAANAGLYKIKAKGNHTTTGTDTFIDVDNVGVVPEAGVVIADSLDIKGFETDGFPQIWRGSYLGNPPAEPITGVITSLNKDLAGVLATIYKSNSIKITSTTERDGSIAIPVSIANASVVFEETEHAQFGNPPHVATRTSAHDIVGLFKRSLATGLNVFLGRYIYTDRKGPLTANAVPDPAPFSGTYSEIVESTGNLTPANVSYDDYISFTRGGNDGQFRSIKAKIATDKVGTQQGVAHTELDYVIGDEYELVRPISISSEDSIVVVMDKDATIKTVDVPMARTGRTNSGSGAGSFSPTTTEFSAFDQDNEPGIDFNNLTVWGTSINGTDFSDYAVWMRARNWYSTGGVAGSGGKMMVRSQQYGPSGEKLRFAINYPTSIDQSPTTTFLNTPSWSLLTYFFGSGPARATALNAGYTIAVKGPYPDTATNFPNGVVSTGNYFDYTFSSGNLASVQVGDIISISDGSGISNANDGQFRVENKSGLTIRVANVNASTTSPGSPEITTVTTIADVVGSSTEYQATVGSSDPYLASASGFGILANSTITNTGFSVLNGDLGLYPGTSVTGFPPGVVNGVQHITDVAAQNAQIDALAAYTTLNAMSGTAIPAVLDGQTLVPGVYTTGAASLAASGAATLTLNGAGTYVIKCSSTLTTGAGGIPTITLSGGATAANVYWVVGSSATINSGFAGTFQGTILASASVTDTIGGTVNGRLIALGAAVTLSAAATINTPNSVSAAALHLTYFIIYDSQGSVAVWYDVNNTGAPAPPHGANRAIKVATVVTGDSASVIATKTGQAIALDNAFTTGVIGASVTMTNTVNGAFANGLSGTSGFVIVTTPGTADASLDGKYFIINDENGSVAVWYDVNDDGTPEPFHGADRSIRVSGVISGDNSTTVAAATVAAVNPDLLFTASNIANVITITNVTDGNVPDVAAGTSGFGMTSTSGSLSSAELITNAGNIALFPLVGNDVATIVSTVNAGTILELVAIGNPALTIDKSTEQEFYAYAGNSTALAYGHNPGVAADRDHVNLYDGVNWVKTFQNVNPNFTMKAPFILNGVAPSVYQMDTTPNANTADLGEFFKLIPVSVKNVWHHLTQKALSQLPIVSNVRISDDRKNVQITSKQLGSAGAIEVIGGNANKAQAYIFGESEVASDASGDYLLMKIPAFPDTFNVGDYIKIENDAGVKRFSRLLATDSISVTNPSSDIIEYNYNPKAIGVLSSTAFTITDVSGSYGRPAGFVWRWTHDGSATLAQVRAGDQVFAFGNTLAWAQGNKVRSAGDGNVAGLPIIAVNDLANYFDVLNPYGKAMSSTTVGVGNTVQITPTPIIKWNLAHASRSHAVSITRVSNLVTVILSSPHFMNTGDSVDIVDSNNVPDTSYGPVTVTSPNQFTFTLAGANFSEADVGASVIKNGLVPTRYRLEKLGFNGMVRISRQDGASPRFTDSGVAVDDYVIIGGTTFKANNNGRFRVLAVDNDSLIIINESASDELNTTTPFNNKGFSATWTANTNLVTGAAGTFKDVNVGDWVKKPEDPDNLYRQVVSFFPGTPASATQITLGGNYGGASAIAGGISYDMLVDYDKGIYLQGQDDLLFLEGDAAASGDTLFVQNLINTNWFSVNNIGSFLVSEVGTDPSTYKPFVRVINPSGTAEANRLMSVDIAGFYLVESLVNKFSTIRQITNIAIDDLNEERRAVYVIPSNRSYKFSEANATSIFHMGKLGYSTDVTTGIDGYLYYTGLLRRVQRIVDGYEPDALNFPGRRAVGGAIETLPPLIRKIIITVNVTTDEGVNLGDISNNIKSVVINYIQTLGVGQDVILSEIIASIMSIKGVGAVTFTNPIPSTERITIADNEKAVIEPDAIGIS